MSNDDRSLPELHQQQLPSIAGETAGTAGAARAKALVETRYKMAMLRPRSLDVVRQDLLKECRRPAFANNTSAWYKKPIGKGVEGLGIRFVEVAIRCMRNISTTVTTTYEDDTKRVLSVTVEDMEGPTPYEQEITIAKTVERSSVKDGQTVLSSRINSQGNRVFTVVADDDSLLNKQNALISKAIRTLGLRLIPGDLQDEAEEIILKVRKDDAARDPAEARKKITDAFLGIGIQAAQLIEYLGHPLDQMTPDEVVDLRGTFGALKDGEATWKSVIENRREQLGGKPPVDADGVTTAPTKGAAGLKAKITKGAPAANAAPAAPAAAESGHAAAGDPPARRSYAALMDAINEAPDHEGLKLLAEEASRFDEPQRTELGKAAIRRETEL